MGDHVTLRDGTSRDGTVPSTTYSGAERLTGKDAVREWVKAREARNLPTDRVRKAILGRAAKELIASGRWDDDTIRQAIRIVGVTKRHPRFLGEWCATVFNREGAKAHENQQAIENVGGWDNLNAQLLAAGLPAITLRRPAVSPGRDTGGDPILSNSRGVHGS